jgi:hypothetical protein
VHRTVLLGLAAVAFAGAAVAQPVLTFKAESVVVSNVKKKGDVLFFGYGEDKPGWTRTIHRWRRTVTANDKGEAELTLGCRVPAMAVIVAFDTETGEFVAAAPFADQTTRVTRRPGPLPSDTWAWDIQDKVQTIQHVGQRLEILVARKKQGGWVGRAVDGGELDADGIGDGVITVSLGQLSPVGLARGRSGGVKVGDVVVLVDPYAMTYWAMQVEKKPK